MMYTQMDIDLDVIAENYKKVSDRLPEETGIIAVVKADAYGLGAVPIAKKLEKAGCPMFAVTFMEEAVKLREAGIKAPILVMMPAESKELLIAGKHKLIITITDYEMAKQISDELVKQSYSLPAHLKVDCGLSRMGIVLKDRLEEQGKTCLFVVGCLNLP